MATSVRWKPPVLKLKMFLGHDGVRPPETLIDIVNKVPMTWGDHCRNIIRSGPALDLHLVSSSFNLRDGTDPGAPGGVGAGWGLQHALVALARRKPHDGRGNHLPLAWELRIMENQSIAMGADIIRSYGLLRSLAAQPKERETLPECIWREFTEEHDHSPDVPEARWRRATPHFIFKYDLEHRTALAGNYHGADVLSAAAARLLPVWRTRLLAAAAAQDCHIHLGQAQVLFEQTRVVKIIRNPDDPPFLAFSDSEGKPIWGLDLFSIFADKARQLETGQFVLEPIRPMKGITTLRVDRLLSINEWVHRLGTNARGGRGPALKLFRVAIAAIGDRRDDDLVKVLGELDQVQKGMVFAFLIARSLILDGHVLMGEAAVNNAYGCEPASRLKYWLRGVKGSIGQGHPHVLPCVAPGEFAKDLQLALAGRQTDHITSEHWSWIREGLLDWIGGDMRVEDEARKRAPGLYIADWDDPRS